MPRILRIINRLNLGGPTYNAAYLTRYLSPEFETLLAAGIKDETEASSEFILRDMGIEPVYISGMKRELSLLNDFSAYQKIKKIIRDFKPDIVHTHAAKAGALGRYAAAELNVPVIVHTFHGHVFHSYFGKLKTSLFIGIERHLASKSTKIIAVSEKQKEELSSDFKICKPEKIEVIPLGFDLNRFRTGMDEKRKSFRNRFLLDDDEVALGIIGRIVPVKNHPFFLNALQKILARTEKKVRAFIIGDGEDKKNIRDLADQLGIRWCDENSIRKNVPLVFTSWIKEIDHAFAGLDIVTLTSLNEGTPVSLIEAQASGKPIVTTRTGGIENVVVAGKTAFLSAIDDTGGFAEHCINLIANESLRKEMGNRGWDAVKDRFSYRNLVENTGNLYKSLLS